jgi:hypothetical protein
MKIDLSKIACENNIRRASPVLANQGIDVHNYCRTLGLGYSDSMWLPFIKVIVKDPKLVSLARSIAISGQIHPIIVLKNGEVYKCISGQRRYVAMVLLEAIRKVLRFDTSIRISEMKALMDASVHGIPSIDYEKLQECSDDLQIEAEIRETLTQEQADKLAFSANEEAEPMNDLDWAIWISTSLKRNNATTGSPFTFEDLSRISNKSVWWLKQRANLMILPAEWQIALDKKEVTIGKASAYALEIVEGTATSSSLTLQKDDSDGSVEASPVLSKAMDVYVKTEEDSDTPEEIPETATETAPVEFPIRDVTEGKRQRRNSGPKMMKYQEVELLLRSLPKSDTYGIELLGKVLKISPEEAAELAGTTADSAV